jgi:hypothetical protein
MAQDGATIQDLINNPNATVGDYQRALAIVLQYSQYIQPGALDVLNRFQMLLQKDQIWSYSTNSYVSAGPLTPQFIRNTVIEGDTLTAVLMDVTSRMVSPNAQVYYTNDGMVFLDPEIAIGYDYTSSVNFRSILIPKPLPGGQDTFELVVGDQTFTLKAGKVFDFRPMFPTGVSAFTIRGIHESERLDPTNLTAFVTGMTFMEKDAAPDLTMKPIVVKQASGSSGLAGGWLLGGSLTCLLLVGACVGTYAWRRKAGATA